VVVINFFSGHQDYFVAWYYKKKDAKCRNVGNSVRGLVLNQTRTAVNSGWILKLEKQPECADNGYHS